jgi:hypothetical protein
MGIANVLQDPVLQLFVGSTLVTSNDDWGTAPNAAALAATGYQPGDSRESAIMITLGPGGYTAIMSGKGGTTGLGLIEVYELDHPEVPLLGISTRAQVGTGDNIEIAGFAVNGPGPQSVIVRARGISMGIPGYLANPYLRLVNAQTGQFVDNNDWVGAPNATQILQSGFQPGDPGESAIFMTLNPGLYTAQVFGADGRTGRAIVEVYPQ